MSIQAVLLPVAVQIGLTFALFALMSSARMQAFRGGLKPQDIAMAREGFPPKARQYANAFSNQFEIPVLFLFAVIFAIVLRQAGSAFVVLEWVFVAARIAQAAIHTTSNIVIWRGATFFVSVIAAALMWILVFVGVFFHAAV